MKNLALRTLVIVCGLSFPSYASLTSSQNGPSVRTISQLKLNPSQLERQVEAKPQSTSMEVAERFFASQINPQPSEKLLATTEFKINLDNFDMEYVLRVQ